jgi:hypothetical protein
MRQRFLAVVTVLVAAAALAGPASANPPPDRVTEDCTSFGSLPPGPPPRVGQITVTSASGHVTTPPLVPGPCSAPGWLKNNPP